MNNNDGIKRTNSVDNNENKDNDYDDNDAGKNF